MQNRFPVKMALAVLSLAGCIAIPAGAQRGTPPTRPARAADGHPNLSGIWQALNTANWDLEDHSAAPGSLFQMGALGATPGGQGVVEGGEIPYKPEALAKKKANFANRLALDPEVKC